MNGGEGGVWGKCGGEVLLVLVIRLRREASL